MSSSRAWNFRGPQRFAQPIGADVEFSFYGIPYRRSPANGNRLTRLVESFHEETGVRGARYTSRGVLLQHPQLVVGALELEQRLAEFYNRASKVV